MRDFSNRPLARVVARREARPSLGWKEFRCSD